MKEENREGILQFIKDNFPSIVTLAGVYIFICSSLYLIGFWNSFKINIFEFIGLYDVIVIAISFILFGVSISVVYILFLYGSSYIMKNYFKIAYQWKVNIILTIVMLISTTFYIYISGKIKSEDIINGKAPLIVDINLSKFDKSNDNELAYVGLAGNHLFFYELLSKRLFIVRVEYQNKLVLIPNPALSKQQKN